MTVNLKIGLQVVALLALLFLAVSSTGCGAGGEEGTATNATGAGEAPAANGDKGGLSVRDDILSDFKAAESWTGDLDGMIERRVIRALVVYNSTNFFFDEDARPRGISFDLLNAFEEAINKKLGTGTLKFHVVPIPVRRDFLISHLRDGHGDLALANLTITDERRELVDFSDPGWSGVDEIVVTGPDSPSITKLEDLAGQEVWVRESSSYFDSLQKLNQSFKQQGLEPVKIQKAEEQLETEYLLEMVAAGLLGVTIADDYIAEAWSEVLDGLQLHPDIAISTGGEIGWMFRKNSPKLAAEVNAFIKKNKQGTLLGNMLVKRYYVNSKWINDATARDELVRLRGMVDLFRNYAGEYNFDWLLIAAQGYQESGLDQSKVSRAGAVGVMQMLRSTAADPNVNIPEIDVLENNIHAGNKYMRFILDHYFADSEMDELNKHLFAFASYNAGPNRIARLRKKAAEQGFDPNVWFQNVEIVVGREVGREPVQYVSNIFKYYVAYKLALDQLEQRG